MQPITALIRKDLILYFSNRRALLMNIVAPIMIAAFFGYLFDSGTKTPSKIPIAVTDLDDSAISKKLIAAIKSDSTLDLREMDEASAASEVQHGKLRAAFTLPKGFGDAAGKALFQSNLRPEILMRYDPSQAMVLAMLRGLLTQHVMQVVTGEVFGAGDGSKRFIADARSNVTNSPGLDPGRKQDLLTLFDSVTRLQGDAAMIGASSDANKAGTGFQMGVPFTTREVEATAVAQVPYNSFAHSFGGMGVQFVLFMGIDMGIGLLLARRLGLWKRLRAAPLSRSALLGARVASGALIAFMLMLIIFAAAIAFFGVRIQGSMIGFIAVVAAFSLLTATFGLLIAALGKTPEATRGLAIVATLLMVMLGGAWVPSFIFPQWLQTVSLVVPARWAIDGLDAMTWRGLGLSAAVMPVAVMLGFSLLFGALALYRFEWEE